MTPDMFTSPYKIQKPARPSKLWRAMKAAGRGLKACGRFALGLVRNGPVSFVKTAIAMASTIAMTGMLAPALLYNYKGDDLVRATVAGRTEANFDDDSTPNHYHFIMTRSQSPLTTFLLGNKFNDDAVRGTQIKEGCAYEFNVNGTTLQFWPPGYSRNITGVLEQGCKR